MEIFSNFYLLFFTAALSYTLSQIAIFFINKVSGWRLIFGIFYSVLVFILQMSLWAITTNTITYYVYGVDLAPLAYLGVFHSVLIPFLFSIFTIIPFLGRSIYVMILLWALCAMVFGLTRITHLTLFESAVAALGGWILLGLLQIVFEKALVRKSNAFWTFATGKQEKLSGRDIEQQLHTLTDDITDFIQKAKA